MKKPQRPRGHEAQQESVPRSETESHLHHLAQAVEQGPASIIITDASGAIHYVNQKFTEVTGYTLEEIRGQNPRLLKSGAMPTDGYAALWQTITAGREWRGEFRNRRKDGTLYWETTSISAIRDADNRITHFVAVKEDTTSRKATEDALAERTRQLEAIRLVSAELTRELDLPTLLALILERAMGLVGAVSGTVFLWDAAEQALVPAVWHGFGPWWRDIRLRLGEGVGGQIAVRRAGMIVNDYRASPYAHASILARTTITASLGEPLLYREELVGVVMLNDEGTGRPFSVDAQTVLAPFAAHAALAIRNARLHAELRQILVEREAMLGTAQQSEGRLRAVLSALTEHIAFVDADGRIVAVNAAWDRFAQENGIAAPSQVGVGVNYLSALRRAIEDGDEIAREALAGIEDVLRGSRGVFRLEYPCHSPTVRRWFLLCATPVAAERLGVVVSHIDITRRKEMEEAVEQRGLQMAALNELSRSLSATLDPREVSHRVLAAAQALIPGCVGRLWEVDADEVTLQVVGGIGLADPRGGQAFRSCDGQGLIGLAASSRQPVVSSVILQDPRFLPDAAWAQSERLVSGCVLPFILAERITGFLSLFTRTLHDFSAEELELLRQFAAQAAVALQNARLHAAVQRQASELEARVRERTVALESALQVKGEFLARMSHEFRTPLNFITGFTDLLGQASADPLTQKQRGYVDRIRTGATRLLGLVEDLLDLSRVDAERTSLRLERFSVQPLILEVLGLFSVQATQKCVRLEFAVGPDLSLVADRRRLFQIVANLVENAVKFTPQGGAVVVTAGPMSAGTERNDGAKAGTRGAATEEQHRREKTAAPGWVEIAVRDTGIGIAPPDLERIFLRFEQADGSPTRQYGGAGIGLALVRMLVDLHGGLIWAESGGQGMGARFAVALPPLSPAAIRRILVVENHPATLKTVGILLRDAGYAVDGVSTAQAAATALAGQPPDLVFLDLGLPDTSGWELLRQIRGTARSKNVQVLAMTEVGDEADAAKALGADALVTKPISATAMIQVVQDLLAGTPRAAVR